MNKLSVAGAAGAGLAGGRRRRLAGPGDLGPRGGFLAQMDLDFGGDDVATVFFDDDVQPGRQGRPGRGAFRSAAISGRSTTSAFEIDASVGYKFVDHRRRTTPTSTCHARCCSWKGCTAGRTASTLGAGLIEHLSPRSTVTVSSKTSSSTMPPASTSRSAGAGSALHYANMYATRSDFFEDVDASHVGLRFTYRFGQRWTN